MSHAQQQGQRGQALCDAIEAAALTLPAQTGAGLDPEAVRDALAPILDAALTQIVEQIVALGGGPGTDLAATRQLIIEKSDEAESVFMWFNQTYGFKVSDWPEPGVGIQVPATKFGGPGASAKHATANLDFPQITIIFCVKGTGTGLLKLGGGLSVSRWTQNSIAVSTPFTTRGLWYPAPVMDNVWNVWAMRYDRTTPLTKPVFRRSFAPVTLFSPAPTTPQGTAIPWGLGYAVGDGWNGGLCHLQVFDRMLTEAEMDEAGLSPGSILEGLQLWLKNPVDPFDSGPHGWHPTITGLSNYAEGGPEGLYP
jgi:hypothetical protein